jgi:hypothetical protein
MRPKRLLVICAVLLVASGCASFMRRGATDGDRDRLFAVDSGGRPISALEAGASLEIGARALTPRTLYEFRLAFGDTPVASAAESISFARATSDAEGSIQPFILWYQSGVIGCSTREADQFRPVHFRTFEEAERALADKLLRISIHEVGREQRPGVALKDVASGPAIAQITLPTTQRLSPLVYPSDESGCLRNSLLTQSADLYVAGRNFQPGETVAISIAPNQRRWSVGDTLIDVTGAGSASATRRVTADGHGRFVVRSWDAANQRRGAYDIVAQRLDAHRTDLTHIDRRDIITYGSDTGIILYLLYPTGGPTMDLAGRPLKGFPYFEYADSFADTNDPVWAAVDPTYVPAAHPGGLYAGFYVVPHRSVPGWDPAMGGATNLADVSGNGVEVMPVKGGCINVSETIVWPAPLTPLGNYDVVVDFGAMPASTKAAWVTDNNYDSTVDFLDGAQQIGFVVAKDPYDLGPTAVGQSSCSSDDFFPTLGTATNVDLRAVIRYPATVAGVDTPVAVGAHPLFIIEHGNHGFCRVCTDNTLLYDRRRQLATGTITSAQYSAICSVYTHDTCPDRTKNHEGYMHLLDTLASNGIIAVSIDAYDLTATPFGYISERADLILKHIELWSHMNDTSTFTSYPDFFAGRFAGHVDLTKISVSGHSRGGEASVLAYLHNAASMNPFSIIAVSSIAPVEFTPEVLPNVPYFVIIGAADGDVTDLGGIRIYDRAGSAIADGTTKSGAYVYGANHNFFNTVWAADWDDWTDSHMAWPARPDMISAADQQKIGEAYLAAFTRMHLNNETVYADMLRGGLTFPSTAGHKIYAVRHESSHSKVDDGTGINGAASGGATTASVNPPSVSVHVTTAARVDWPSNTALFTYTVPMAQRDASTFEVLSFRVAQTNAPSNPASGDQDFEVELQGGGHTLAVYSSRFASIPKPYARPDSIKNVMTTVRIPLHSFIMNHSGVALDNVDMVRLKFINPATGEIYVDDVEFSR